MFGLKFNLETFVASQFAHAHETVQKKTVSVQLCDVVRNLKSLHQKIKTEPLGCDAILLQISETALSLFFSGKMRIE